MSERRICMKSNKTDQTERPIGLGRVLLRLLALVHGLEGWMILAIVAGVAGFLCALGIPVFGIAAAASSLDGPWAISFGTAALCMILFAVLRGILRYGEQACNHYIAFRLLAQIRDKVFGKLRKLGPEKLDGKSKGDLISLISSDVELLEVFYAHTISPVCIALISALLYVIIGFSVHYSIGLLLLASYLSVSLFIPLLYGKKASVSGMERRKANAALSSVVLENVRGIDEIIQYSMKDSRQEKMDQQTHALLDAETSHKKETISVSNTALLFVTLFSLAMTLLCVSLAGSGAIYWDQALVMIVFQASSFGPFMALSNLTAGLSQTLAAARRVIALLDEKPLTPEITNGKDVVYTGMQTDEMSFSYDKKTPVLEQVSLSFAPGEIVGIEGKSGCGKSTLLRLLMRFYDPDKGTVSMSDTPLNKLNTRSLRSKQSVVLQESILFTDSIRNNLLLAKPDATDEEIKAACRKASIDTLIESLPDGYDTILAEAGSSLSSGEKQRLGLARALLHDGEMLLMDEPTSNLDSLNEGAILRAIATETQQKTVILISHRKGTLSFADRILEMEKVPNETREKA